VSRLSLARSRSDNEPVAHFVVRDFKNRAFRLVEDDVGFVLGLVGVCQDLVGGKDQAPEGRLFLDDARVVLDVGRPRHAVDERRDIRGPADLLEIARAAQLLLEGDEIDGVAALDELHHLVENAPVRIAEEIARVDDLDGGIERVVVEQDRAEDGSLGLEIVRERALGDGFGHTSASWKVKS
jgi:hypothetical protein